MRIDGFSPRLRPVIAVVVVIATAFANIPPETKLNCDTCASGHFMKSSCDENIQTICEICPDGTYSPSENVEKQCRPCTVCAEGYFEATQCFYDHDTVCVSCSANRLIHTEAFHKKCRLHSSKSSSSSNSSDQDLIVSSGDGEPPSQKEVLRNVFTHNPIPGTQKVEEVEDGSGEIPAVLFGDGVSTSPAPVIGGVDESPSGEGFIPIAIPEDITTILPLTTSPRSSTASIVHVPIATEKIDVLESDKEEKSDSADDSGEIATTEVPGVTTDSDEITSDAPLHHLPTGTGDVIAHTPDDVPDDVNITTEDRVVDLPASVDVSGTKLDSVHVDGDGRPVTPKYIVQSNNGDGMSEFIEVNPSPNAFDMQIQEKVNPDDEGLSDATIAAVISVLLIATLVTIIVALFLIRRRNNKRKFTPLNKENGTNGVKKNGVYSDRTNGDIYESCEDIKYIDESDDDSTKEQDKASGSVEGPNTIETSFSDPDCGEIASSKANSSFHTDEAGSLMEDGDSTEKYSPTSSTVNEEDIAGEQTPMLRNNAVGV